MKHLLSLILCFGLYSHSKAQTVNVLDTEDISTCIYFDREFYDIRSNDILSTLDYNLVFTLDNEMFIHDLYPTDCFVFKTGESSIITFELQDRDRSYLIQNNKPVRIFDYYPNETKIIDIK